MSIYRIRISQPGRPRLAYTGLFSDGFEAALQALADWPQARGVSVIHIKTGATS